MTAPGNAHREGISLVELVDLFPNEVAARAWFEGARWAKGRTCPRCGSDRTKAVPSENPMPFHCADCRRYFSVKTGTVMQSSKLTLRKWLVGIYLMSTSLKGVSSTKLHRDLGITQKTAWMMAQKISESWAAGSSSPMDSTLDLQAGGKRENMPFTNGTYHHSTLPWRILTA